MKFERSSAAVLGLLAVSIAGVLAFGALYAHAQTPPAVALPSAAANAAPAPAAATSPAANATTVKPSLAPAKPPVAKAAPAPSKPFWQDLTPAQQKALTPLAQDWNKLDSTRKEKWLQMSTTFAAMKPDEQARVHERMREWAGVTPAQRRTARESFTRAKKLDPEQKTAQWEKYQQLPEEQKQKLAADAAAKKPVATLPPVNNKAKIIAPIKSTPKPVLENSVTPQATAQSNIQPSPLPPVAPAVTPPAAAPASAAVN